MSEIIPRKRMPVRTRLHFALVHADGFQHWLGRRGYTRSTIVECLRLLSHWTDWAHKAGFTCETILAGFQASRAVFQDCRKGQERLKAGSLFIRYLQELGLVARPVPPTSPTQIWPLLGAFRTWMQDQRGVARSSLDTYQTILVDLLETLGSDPAAYTATAIRDFVLARARPHGLARAKSITTATRVFLRYLVATGQCPPGRDHAVPAFASWQLTAVPTALGAEEVDRVIAACDGESRLRDRAIILLLSRLGLRASEAASLEFSHIDWKNGCLSVTGKSRRQEWLPLTQEVGDALIAYIERGRPRLATPRIFITSLAPPRPVNRAVVKHIVGRALARAGVQSAHRGAHVLRHSAATAMLRNGVSLAGVGAVLRHRSLTMTMHYAKVDMALLSAIAQPWAGRVPC